MHKYLGGRKKRKEEAMGLSATAGPIGLGQADCMGRPAGGLLSAWAWPTGPYRPGPGRSATPKPNDVLFLQFSKNVYYFCNFQKKVYYLKKIS